jgi:hypothetical protein
MRLRTVVLLGVLLTGCQHTTTPAAPSNAIVERFSGTVQPGRKSSNMITTTVEGTIKVTLQALTPGDEVVGVGLGGDAQRIGVTDCALGQNNVVTMTDIGKPVLLEHGTAGQHCVVVFDVAFYDPTIAPLHAAQTYTIEVIHQ